MTTNDSGHYKLFKNHYFPHTVNISIMILIIGTLFLQHAFPLMQITPLTKSRKSNTGIMPAPHSKEAMKDYLYRISKTTGNVFICNPEQLKIDPAKFYNKSCSTNNFMNAWSSKMKVKPILHDNMFALPPLSIDTNNYLKDEQYYWDAILNDLDYIMSFSRDQIEEEAKSDGWLHLNDLPEQQKVAFWNRNKRLHEIAPGLNGLFPDDTSMRISVSRTASIRLIKSNGEQLSWLGIFGYSAKGLLINP